jgi:hypothetical protein
MFAKARNHSQVRLVTIALTTAVIVLGGLFSSATVVFAACTEIQCGAFCQEWCDTYMGINCDTDRTEVNGEGDCEAYCLYAQGSTTSSFCEI